MNMYATQHLPPETRAALKKTFIDFYEKAYAGWTKEQLGFPPEELNTWLNKQFHENVGKFFIANKDNTCFVTYTTERDVVNIFKIVGSDEDKVKLFHTLARFYNDKPYYGVIRKDNQAAVDFYVKQGCKIVDNKFPQYSNTHYIGLEMPQETIKKITAGGLKSSELTQVPLI